MHILTSPPEKTFAMKSPRAVENELEYSLEHKTGYTPLWIKTHKKYDIADG